MRNIEVKLRYPILEHFHPHPLFGPLLMLIIPPISTYNHKTIGQYEIIVSEKLLKMSLLGPIKSNHVLFQALLEITMPIIWAN